MATGKIDKLVSSLYGLSQLKCVLNSSEAINFDTEQRFCIYFNASASSGTKPFTGNGYLFTIVRDTAGTALQIAFPNSVDAGNPKIRTNLVGTSWTAWKTISVS